MVKKNPSKQKWLSMTSLLPFCIKAVLCYKAFKALGLFFYAESAEHHEISGNSRAKRNISFYLFEIAMYVSAIGILYPEGYKPWYIKLECVVSNESMTGKMLFLLTWKLELNCYFVFWHSYCLTSCLCFWTWACKSLQLRWSCLHLSCCYFSGM